MKTKSAYNILGEKFLSLPVIYFHWNDKWCFLKRRKNLPLRRRIQKECVYLWYTRKCSPIYFLKNWSAFTINISRSKASLSIYSTVVLLWLSNEIEEFLLLYTLFNNSDPKKISNKARRSSSSHNLIDQSLQFKNSWSLSLSPLADEWVKHFWIWGLVSLLYHSL